MSATSQSKNKLDQLVDHPPCWIVMGVSGCGKSSIGKQLAVNLSLKYIEGDDAHPAANVAKMASGQPLNDDDRHDWLMILHSASADANKHGYGLVVSCSALKRRYRDLLRSANPAMIFLHLHGDRELIFARMQARSNHFMPASLLDSQLVDLEMLGDDERGITLDIRHTPNRLLEMAQSASF